MAVAIIMMVVAGFFTLCAVLSLFLLKQVSGLELQNPWGWDICSWGGHLSSFGLGISVFLKSEHSQNGAGGAFCVSAELLGLRGEQAATLGRGAGWTGGADAAARHDINNAEEVASKLPSFALFKHTPQAHAPELRACRLMFFLLLCFPGAFPVPAHGSQLPKGSGRVFPRHPHQQELPERGGRGGLLSCTQCFPGQLALAKGRLCLASPSIVTPTFIF